MPEEAVILHGAPTLAGIKTGNIFRCAYESENEMRTSLRQWNRAFSEKGLRVIPLSFRGNKALLYLYRPARLLHDLDNEKAADILKACGYCAKTPGQCLGCLVRRIQTETEFPHEIGLFLGYPAEDVQGFMEHQGSGCKCVGYWKVYGDVQAAQKTFDKYRKCTDVYYRQWSQGKPIERLTVSRPNI
jgi:hypothetical protein